MTTQADEGYEAQHRQPGSLEKTVVWLQHGEGGIRGGFLEEVISEWRQESGRANRTVSTRCWVGGRQQRRAFQVPRATF